MLSRIALPGPLDVLPMKLQLVTAIILAGPKTPDRAARIAPPPFSARLPSKTQFRNVGRPVLKTAPPLIPAELFFRRQLLISGRAEEPTYMAPAEPVVTQFSIRQFLISWRALPDT